ncbi:coiled-coil domain-containing protein [Vibrio parahaemolyticus]|uniref:DNA-binding protein n=1 Tax=Vibrio parahaemolyticus TaxID=670 RepID=UPI0004DF3FA0|nr:DNA-binding protein [Vibrio parahaemolyticus]
MTTDRNMQERVNEICNDLYGRGEKVSVRVILTYLPDVSSTSTVHKYYANWRKELEANEKSLYEKLGFSSEFTQMFMKEISRFSVEAEQRYKGIADEANEQRDTAIEELAKAEDRLHKQTALVEQQGKEISQLKSDITANEKAHAAELEKVKESHDVLVLELRHRIEQLEKELNEAVKGNESLRTELAKSQLKLESNQDYVNEVKAKQEQLEQQGVELQDKNQVLSNQNAKLETQREADKELISSINERLHDLKENADSLQTKLSESEAAYKTVSIELSEYKSQVNSQSQKIGSLEQMNEQQQRYIEKLEKVAEKED